MNPELTTYYSEDDLNEPVMSDRDLLIDAAIDAGMTLAEAEQLVKERGL